MAYAPWKQAEVLRMLNASLDRCIESNLRNDLGGAWQSGLPRPPPLYLLEKLDLLESKWAPPDPGAAADDAIAVIGRLQKLAAEAVEGGKPLVAARAKRLIHNVGYVINLVDPDSSPSFERLLNSTAANREEFEAPARAQLASSSGSPGGRVSDGTRGRVRHPPAVSHQPAGPAHAAAPPTPAAAASAPSGGSPARRRYEPRRRSPAASRQPAGFPHAAAPPTSAAAASARPLTALALDNDEEMDGEPHDAFAKELEPLARGRNGTEHADMVVQEPQVAGVHSAPQATNYWQDSSGGPAKPLVVVDGPNVAHRHGNGEFSPRGILLAIAYFERNDCACVVCVPDGRLKLEVTVDFDGNAMEGDSNEVTFALQRFAASGHIFFTPKEEYDDAYLLHYALSRGGLTVSNDRFRDVQAQYSAGGKELGKLFSEYLDGCRMPYAFRGDEFIPSPGFSVHEGASLARSLVKRYMHLVGNVTGFQHI